MWIQEIASSIGVGKSKLLNSKGGATLFTGRGGGAGGERRDTRPRAATTVIAQKANTERNGWEGRNSQKQTAAPSRKYRVMQEQRQAKQRIRQSRESRVKQASKGKRNRE